MQDPPSSQPPLQQPYSSPSQIYEHEQQLSSLPAGEITRPFMPAQGMAVYHNHQWIKRFTILSVALLVIVLMGFLLLFALNFSTYSSIVEPDDAIPLVIMVVLAAIVSWFAWIWLAWVRTYARAPFLVISREGITVGRLPLRSGIFFSWAAIESVYSYTGPVGSYNITTSLCIRPRNIEQFLARLPYLERIVMRTNRETGAPVVISKEMLDRPVEAILQQLSSWYAGELSYYQIRVLHVNRNNAWPRW